MSKKQSEPERLYGLAVKVVESAWGRPLRLIGSTLRRALIAEEILFILAAQDETMSSKSIKELLNGMFVLLMQDENGA